MKKYLFLDKVETIKATKQHIDTTLFCRTEDLVIEYKGLERFFNKIFYDDLSYIEPKGVYLKADLARNSEYVKYNFFYASDEEMLLALEEIKNLSKVIQYN